MSRLNESKKGSEGVRHPARRYWIDDPVRMRSHAERRARRSVVVDVAIVAAAFVVGAVVAPATLLASFAVLLAAGAAVGLRGAPTRRPIALGSAAGALLIYGWTVVREPPSDVSSALRNGLLSAVALALILGAAFVLPGYLFGRASRRSRETAALADGSSDFADRARVPSGSGVRSDVGAGVLILLAVVAVIVWIFNHPLGP
jgi:hypothetical protein